MLFMHNHALYGFLGVGGTDVVAFDARVARLQPAHAVLLLVGWWQKQPHKHTNTLSTSYHAVGLPQGTARESARTVGQKQPYKHTTKQYNPENALHHRTRACGEQIY